VERHHNYLKYGGEIEVFYRVERFGIVFLYQQFNIQLMARVINRLQVPDQLFDQLIFFKHRQ
jgi:hypothetical protein